MCSSIVCAVHDGVESLAPGAVEALERLGLNIPGAGVELTAWWGTNEPRTMFERAARLVSRLDLGARLRARARELGAQLVDDVRQVGVVSDGNSFELDVGTPTGVARVTARRLVDATGQIQPSSLVVQVPRRHSADRLFLQVVEIETGYDGVLTEAASFGWWSLCGHRGHGTLSLNTTLAAARRAANDLAGRVQETRLAGRVRVVGAATVRDSGSTLALLRVRVPARQLLATRGNVRFSLSRQRGMRRLFATRRSCTRRWSNPTSAAKRGGGNLVTTSTSSLASTVTTRQCGMNSEQQKNLNEE